MEQHDHAPSGRRCPTSWRSRTCSRRTSPAGRAWQRPAGPENRGKKNPVNPTLAKAGVDKNRAKRARKPAKRDEALKDKLVIEYPAILRWAIDGWLDMQANGPIRPAVIVEATRGYLDDENRIAAWLTERCEIGPLHKELLKHLFADWKTWCEANGEDPQSNRRLKARLERLPGIQRSKQDMHGIWIGGIRLAPKAGA